MEIFLTYGRILTPDEVDKLALDEKDRVEGDVPVPCEPKMEAFREQIDHYENLFMEIEDMQPYKIFNNWFQVKYELTILLYAVVVFTLPF